MENEDIYKKALDHFGHPNQILKCIEECGELIQELAKYYSDYRPFGGSCDLPGNLPYEIADVQIMLDQMKLIFGVEEVNLSIAIKVRRLVKKMEEIKNDKEPK